MSSVDTTFCDTIFNCFRDIRPPNPVGTHTHTHTQRKKDTHHKWFYILSYAMYCNGQTIILPVLHSAVCSHANKIHSPVHINQSANTCHINYSHVKKYWNYLAWRTAFFNLPCNSSNCSSSASTSHKHVQLSCIWTLQLCLPKVV